MRTYTFTELLSQNGRIILEEEKNKPAFIIELERFCEKNEWTYRITQKEDLRIFIATPIGVWKIIPIKSIKGTYNLCHHNFLKGIEAINDIRIEKGMKFYHFQHDIKTPFSCIQALLEYIKRHDLSRLQEQKGVKTMPCKTKKQRKWKRDAKKREKRRQIKNVYKIFENL